MSNIETHLNALDKHAILIQALTFWGKMHHEVQRTQHYVFALRKVPASYPWDNNFRLFLHMKPTYWQLEETEGQVMFTYTLPHEEEEAKVQEERQRWDEFLHDDDMFSSTLLKSKTLIMQGMFQSPTSSSQPKNELNEEKKEKSISFYFQS